MYSLRVHARGRQRISSVPISKTWPSLALPAVELGQYIRWIFSSLGGYQRRGRGMEAHNMDVPRSVTVCENCIAFTLQYYITDQKNSRGGTGRAESFGRQDERVMYAWLRKNERETCSTMGGEEWTGTKMKTTVV